MSHASDNNSSARFHLAEPEDAKHVETDSVRLDAFRVVKALVDPGTGDSQPQRSIGIGQVMQI